MVLESSHIDWILLEFIALLRSLYNFDKEVWSSFSSSFPSIEFSLLFIPKNQIIKIKKMNNISIIHVKNLRRCLIFCFLPEISTRKVIGYKHND